MRLESHTAVAKLATGPRSITTLDLLMGLPMILLSSSSDMVLLPGRAPGAGPARTAHCGAHCAANGRRPANDTHRRRSYLGCRIGAGGRGPMAGMAAGARSQARIGTLVPSE